MKTTVAFILLSIGLNFLAHSQTSHTVSNAPGTPAQFDNLQDAINAAANGDIIYIAGSPNTYGSVTLSKRLTLIGAGHTDTTGLKTIIASLILETSADNAPPSGSRFMGMYFIDGINAYEDHIISNVIVERCRFITNFSTIEFRKADAWIIRNNWFGNSVGNLYFNNETTNMLVEGNIFSDFNTTITGSNDLTIGGDNPAVVVFANNYFFTTDVEIENATFQNNVFINCLFSDEGNRIFRNNLFYIGTSPDDDATSDFYDNIQGDPLFEDEGDTPGIYNFTDVRLQASSPGKNAGTDGTDIGIYGGNQPFKPFPSNPEIRLLQINSTSIPQGESLEFTIKAVGRN